MKLLLLLFIAVASLSLQSCSGCKFTNTPAITKPDNPYGLPNATNEGLGVFACRINGVTQIAKNDVNHIGAWMSSNRDTLNTYGSFGKNYFQVLSIGTIQRDRRINVDYSFDDTLLTRFLYGTDSTCMGVSTNIPDIIKAIGSITYSRLDTTNQIVSGIFNCRIPIPNCDTLNVTDGRFDIKYHY